MGLLIFISVELLLFVLLYYVCKQLSNYVDTEDTLCKRFKAMLRGTIGE